METLASLDAQMKELQQKMNALRKRKLKSVNRVLALMATLDVSVDDLVENGASIGQAFATASTGKPSSTTSAGKLPPKYRNPRTGETWSGHARAPAWIKNVKDRSKFLIEGDDTQGQNGDAASGAADRSAARGKLPPKYRNPKTGETWSGHARPPAWIKGTADRSVFLIENEGTGKKSNFKAAVKRAPEAVQPASEPQNVVARVGAAKSLGRRNAVKKATRKVPMKKGAAKKGAVHKTARVTAAEQSTAAASEASATPT